MTDKDLGIVTAYGYAVEKGYTGTEEEFAALMADYAAVGQRAEQSAAQAAASATAASGSAGDSAASATAAEGFAGNASTAAGNAAQAASQAAQSATQAAGSATTAGTAATNAQAAQTAAETAQTAAENAADDAETAAASVAGKAAQIDQNTEDISLVKSHLQQRKRDPHNLLSGVGLTANTRWLANASTPQSINGYTLTDYIEVESSKQYSFVTNASISGAGYGGIGLSVFYAQFDASKNVILQDNNGYTDKIVPGTTTKYLRISYTNVSADDNPRFVEAPFTGELADPDTEIYGLFKSVSTEEISFKSKNQQYKDLLAPHKTSLVKSKYLTNGKITGNENWMVLTDFIPCKPNTDYNGAFLNQTSKIPTLKVAWYSEDGTYISEVQHANASVFTSPSTAQYFRISTIQKSTQYPDLIEDFSTVVFGECDLQYGPPCIDPAYTFTDIYPLTSLKDKRWAAFGDSLTEKNVRSTINYHDYIRAETGITIMNKGVGGAGYKTRWQNGNCMYQLAEAVEDLSTYDAVTVFAGINDAWSELTTNMGNVGDVFDAEATAQNQSVMACFNHFLDIVETKAPMARIGVISPIPCYHTSGSTLYNFNPADDTSTMAQFVEKCKEQCRKRGIPYLDLFHNSGLRPWDTTVNNAMFKCYSNDSPDGLHPNHLGHKYIYPMIREFIKTLL